MKIFILEDDEERVDLFLEVLKGQEVTVARTVEEGKKKFSPDFQVLLLDHDLGGRQMVRVGEGEETGLDFAEWLGEAPDPSPEVVIHSWNPDGGSRMLFLLYDMGWNVIQMPFGTNLLRTLEGVSKEAEELKV